MRYIRTTSENVRDVLSGKHVVETPEPGSDREPVELLELRLGAHREPFDGDRVVTRRFEIAVEEPDGDPLGRIGQLTRRPEVRRIVDS